MFRPLFALIAIMSLAVLADEVGAATWRVEKDGSGDFTVIQDAIEAAANGDSILIGPGRFDDFGPIQATAWQSEAIINVVKDDLTLIGAGTAETIIGPVEMYTTGALVEPMAIASTETLSVSIIDLTVANAYTGLYWSYGSVTIDNCRIENFQDGAVLFCEGGATISNTVFDSGPDFGSAEGIIAYWPCEPVSISGCTFRGAVMSEDAIYLSGIESAVVSDCVFHTSSGLSLASSACTMVDCTAASTVGLGAWATSESQLFLEGNRLHGYFAAIYVDSGSQATGSGNEFTGGADLATIYVSTASRLALTGNHILKNGTLAVMASQFQLQQFRHQNLTGNYWGTTETDSLDAWIQDMNDDPGIHSVVDYLPIAETPLAAEPASLGGLKAMFR